MYLLYGFVQLLLYNLLFQTVMNLYLLEGIPLIAKHTAVLYLLFDLMHLEENADVVSMETISAT